MKKKKFHNVNYLEALWHPKEQVKPIYKNICNKPRCKKEGLHKAPKVRNPQKKNDYTWYCINHIVEFNKKWNYFSGMTEVEITNEKLKSLYGDRPTWYFSSYANLKDYAKFKKINFKAQKYFNYQNKSTYNYSNYNRSYNLDHKTIKALRILNISYPYNLSQLKKNYKLKVKKYHPDLNQQNKDSTYKFRQIQYSYELLKNHLKPN